jgi:integrase
MITAPHRSPPTTVNLTVKPRRYLTEREVDRLIETARKNRHGHRDATMVLVAYRHGLRASELCDLQWHQIELSEGRLHVRRVKNGMPSVHPIRGDEMRALRRLRRENPTEAVNAFRIAFSASNRAWLFSSGGTVRRKSKRK